MPIEALPSSTTRLLGSAQVLTTPVSLVKELIDNALDAKATLIDVSISEDTLTKLEVRDNGSGIAPDDLDSLGRRGYTSKLRSFEELRSIGGSSLGFRGEALASAVTLGEVSITTRTEGEQVAALINLKRPGGIESRKNVSHPVGTTITVKNFLTSMPVRKKNAEKDASKTLLKVKEMVQRYAFARPLVKISLKTLKPRNKASSIVMSYVPHPSEGLRGVASQVIGKDAANQCFEKTAALPAPVQTGETQDTEDFTLNSGTQIIPVVPDGAQFFFQASMIKKDAELSKIGRSPYVSIDSRPVSCARGVLKKLVAAYKEHVRSACRDASAARLKDPFLRLNIVCRSGSYDPNVEPAKDDVVFENEDLLLDLFVDFLKQAYGELKPRGEVATLSDDNVTTLPGVQSEMQHDLSSSVNHGAPEVDMGDAPMSTGESQPAKIVMDEPMPNEEDDGNDMDLRFQPDLAVLPGKRSWGFSSGQNYDNDAEEDESPHQPSSSHGRSSTRFQDEEADSAPIRMNPWTIAKMHARPQKTTSSTTGSLQAAAGAVEKGDMEKGDVARDAARDAGPADLPTPRQSSEPLTETITRNPLSLAPQALQLQAQRALEQRPRPQLSVSALQNSSALQGSLDEWRARHRLEPSLGQVSNSADDEPFINLLAEGGSEAQSDTGRNRRDTPAFFPAPGRMGEERLDVVGAPDQQSTAGFISSKALMLQKPWSPPPTLEDKPAKRSRRPNRPFVSPIKRGSADPSSQSNPFVSPPMSSNPVNKSAGFHNRPKKKGRDNGKEAYWSTEMDQPEADGRLQLTIEQSLDYERRKESAGKRRRQELRSQVNNDVSDNPTMSAPRPSPHKNRYRAAVSELEAYASQEIGTERPVRTERQPDAEVNAEQSLLTQSVLPPGDPRAFLMRRRKQETAGTVTRTSSGKPKRAKSSLLPLETIAEPQQVHMLVQHVSTSLDTIQKQHSGPAVAQERFTEDRYEAGISLDARAFVSMKMSLDGVVRGWIRRRAGEEHEVDIDVSELRELGSE